VSLNRTVAVTGATGFIGAAIVRQLVLEGYTVRILVRPESMSKAAFSEHVEIIPGDLENPSSLNELLTGANALVHCAGVLRGAAKATFERINTEAVRQLVKMASQQHDLERFLLISSLAASQPHVSPYAASKRAGELAMALAPPHLACLALRPPAVYGPGDKELLPLFKAMAHGFAPRWAPAENRFSLIFVSDLVSAAIRWLASPVPAAGIYELHDGREGGYSMDEINVIAESVLRRRIRAVRVPAYLLDAIAMANIALARVFPFQPMLTPWKLGELRYPRWVCDNNAFASATAWEPQISFSKGLSLALADDG
jgi:2-alkyl-3-oxoalkanoate reductase